VKTLSETHMDKDIKVSRNLRKGKVSKNGLKTKNGQRS
jgi:hypothetical protein